MFMSFNPGDQMQEVRRAETSGCRDHPPQLVPQGPPSLVLAGGNEASEAYPSYHVVVTSKKDECEGDEDEEDEPDFREMTLSPDPFIRTSAS